MIREQRKPGYRSYSIRQELISKRIIQIYVSTGATDAKDSKDLTKELEDAKAEKVKVQSEMMAKIEALIAKLASKVDAQIEDAIQNVAKV